MQNNSGPDTARRVLVVDDDQDYAASLIDLMEPYGYEMRTVDRPETAIDALQWEGLAVVMLDVRLGVTSGVDLLARMKGKRTDLIYVMMTAYSDTATAIKALRHGASDYCDKSCTPGELRAVLDRCFERRQLREERRAAYEALRVAKEEADAARQRAEAADAAKSQFLATMSHELRTPLNAIIGFSEVIERAVAGPLSSKYLEYAGYIHKSGEHLLSIVNDVLDVAKLQAGKTELHREPTRVGDIIEDAVGLTTMQAAAGEVSVSSCIEDGIPPINADQIRLRQVLLNLLANAIKFTPHGGKVSVEARRWLTGIRIDVADTGIGIAVEDIPRVLEPFTQIGNTFSRTHEGTGLGLPLSKGLVELHGGRLEITSALGRGTTVTVYLPVESGDASVADVPASDRVRTA